MITLLLISCFLCSHPVDEVKTTAVADTIYYSDSGYVKFTSEVPLHTFSGESDKLAGMIDFKENIIDFFVDLNTLETGNGKRDRDMLETLNADQHPFAEFSGEMEPITEVPLPGEKITVTASGTFIINGVSNELTLEGSLQNENDILILEASWDLSLADYNIEPPGILFYRVNDIQKLEIKVKLEPKSKSELDLQN
jgi:polyisoprenoid-binding protein YceI